jgi:hypothetical protein
MSSMRNNKNLGLASAIAVILTVASCSQVFSKLDNPADPKSPGYQGYPTVADAGAVKPASPGGGAAILYTPRLVALKVTGADLYHFQIAKDTSFSSGALAHENSAVTANEYLPLDWTSLALGTTYYWRVRAHKEGTWGPFCTDIASFSLTTPSAGATVPVDGTTVSSAKPSFDWVDIVGATGYRIQISASSDFSATVTDDSNLAASTWAQVPALADAATYYWRVAAKSVDGVWSAWTAISRFTVVYPAAATPSFDPAGGTYAADQSVTISTMTANATIYYTTDGSIATTGSAKYIGAIDVADNGTVLMINAIAISGVTKPSAPASATYTIAYPAAAAPTFAPLGGTYQADQSVTLSTTTPGATIYYTTDGSAPTTGSTKYTGAILTTVSPATTINAIAMAPAFAQSPSGTATYTNVYSIGDVGPAGGFVFYDKGSFSSGWRYLEAAPSDQSTGITWQSNYYTGSLGTTSYAVGTGAANTAALVAYFGPGSYAAKLCADLALGGYHDWFLPSIDELVQMYGSLKAHNLGGFSNRDYWSSTDGQFGARFMSYRDGSGSTDMSGWGGQYSVRAVRAF